VGEKAARWCVIGQGETLPASSQHYQTARSRGLRDILIFRSGWLSNEISRFLWSPRIHYCVYKNALLVPVMNHINPAQTSPPSISSLILLFHPYLGLLSGLFPSGFRRKFLCIFVLLLMMCSNAITVPRYVSLIRMW
jgi:hypothetical protein